MDCDQRHFEFALEKVAPLGRIGLIALATDFNMESDLRRMLPAGVDLFTNRIMNTNPMTLENLEKMSSDLTRAAKGILPNFGVDVMIYGCTSGTIAIGEQKVQDLIRISCPNVPVTNPATALVSALEFLEVKKLSVITPYNAEINSEFQDYLENKGFEVLSFVGFGFEDDIQVTKIPPKVIYDQAVANCHPEAEALFLSCTGLRASQVLQEIESKLGIPIISSNQALAWHALQIVKCPMRVNGFGRLLQPIPAVAVLN